MTLCADSLELDFSNRVYSLSARRLWEHTELGQISVFRRSISTRRALNDEADFIDLVFCDEGGFTQTGLTLADLKNGQAPDDKDFLVDEVLSDLTQRRDGQIFISQVATHLSQCANRMALRNQQPPFLPSAKSGDLFGIPWIFSSLQRRLQVMGKSKAGPSQWLKTIDNFRTKGVRLEELNASNLALALEELGLDSGKGTSITALDLADLCNFSELRFSVIPLVKAAKRPMHFGRPPDTKLKAIKNLPKGIADLPRLLTKFDRVLGYRIERVEHNSLWGQEHSWQAVTHEGQIIKNPSGATGFETAKEAANLAAQHAQQHFPKRVALGNWSHLAWTGGERYREWLVTLPYYPSNYLAGHFKVRNVLAHIRCDVRDDGDGGRVLMLHEVQSDWAQQARRAISEGEMDEFDDERPPFLKEWPALVMKLVLLHSAYQGLDAVAWTRGDQQISRYKGLGADGLIELYDRTLPRAVNRMMKPLGVEVEMLGVFVPDNFSIKETEYGYEVFSANDELLGTAATLVEAREFVPDQGIEMIYDVHAVRLSFETRQGLMATGFPAWG